MMHYFDYSEDINISKNFPSRILAEEWFENMKKDYQERGFELYDENDILADRFADFDDGTTTAYFSAAKEVINPNYKEDDAEVDLDKYTVLIP